MSALKHLLLIAILILPACMSATAEDTALPSPNGDLAGTQWELVSYGLLGSETPVITGSTITLEFGPDNQITGSGGCNSFGGGYQVEGNMILFSQINRTLMACADQAVTQQEGQYVQALQSAGQFEQTDSELTIWYDAGSGVLNYVPASVATTN